MAHVHQQPGQHDLTVSAFIVRTDLQEPRVLVHRHKTLGIYLQVGGHVELDEQPWAALVREVAEETGYDADQLSVLQPQDRFQSPNAVVHPQPVCVHTVPFGTLNHYHIDMSYALVAASEPSGQRAAGESADLRWLTLEDVRSSDLDIPEDVRDQLEYVLNHVLKAWQPIPVTSFTTDDPVQGGMAAHHYGSNTHRSAVTGLWVVNSGRRVASEDVADSIDEDL